MEHLLPKILPAGILSDELDLACELQPLFPGEAELVERAVHKRRHEFRAGRACARKALAGLGFPPAALLSNADRSPQWPPGVVGSISHTGNPARGWCGAAVGKTGDWAGIGIDAELASPLETDLWSRILRPSEQRFLAGVSASESGQLAKLIFCAKEAFYKCQYPRTLAFLGFQDVEIELELSTSTFRLGKVASSADSERSAEELQLVATVPVLLGKYLFTPELIVTAVCWPH